MRQKGRQSGLQKEEWKQKAKGVVAKGRDQRMNVWVETNEKGEQVSDAPVLGGRAYKALLVERCHDSKGMQDEPSGHDQWEK